jgi:hypothetical protein
VWDLIKKDTTQCLETQCSSADGKTQSFVVMALYHVIHFKGRYGVLDKKQGKSVTHTITFIIS